MAFIIRSYRNRKLWFWQVPHGIWNPETNSYNQSEMAGGWIDYSRNATRYATRDLAESVNAIRYLGGTVEEYLTQ